MAVTPAIGASMSCRGNVRCHVRDMRMPREYPPVIKGVETDDMSNLSEFGAYAAAFEESLLDDDWRRLERYFSPDASYLPGDGTQASGRDAVLKALQDSVNALERKSDSRELVGEPEVTESGDTITLKFTLKYTKAGMADLILTGHETVQYADGVILKMEDVFDDPAGMVAWRESL